MEKIGLLCDGFPLRLGVEPRSNLDARRRLRDHSGADYASYVYVSIHKSHKTVGLRSP